MNPMICEASVDKFGENFMVYPHFNYPHLLKTWVLHPLWITPDFRAHSQDVNRGFWRLQALSLPIHIPIVQVQEI